MDTPDFAPAAAAVVGDVVAVSLVEEEAAVVGGEAVWGHTQPGPQRAARS
ncbi:hypothetical protein I551_7191 [Mycobacterium ulcerans str. Harvey]|uniref:Uncharacterized protein n=1 Tax=Mycobacterium ulcerans str. Harvey TaxID=1299332 RepID=A0ABP3A4H2_MYCUL|nr:hypothetical protein I551_7191 [Mycobacterium ulcerans str. Harvey]